MLNLRETKIKKMNAILQSLTNHEEYTFKQSDQYTWSDKDNCLYVMTSSYQMY